MATPILAGLLVLVFTSVLTIAGVGSAFIVIPTLYWLSTPLTEAMAVGLLLNTIGMTVASVSFARHRLIVYRTAVPVVLLAVVFSPLGARAAQGAPRTVLLALFVAFLVFAGAMMLLYRPRSGGRRFTPAVETAIGAGVGVGAGFLGGLLGVGGGNFIVPALVWLGFDPKRASATTAFIVIFSSLAGFLGHATVGGVSWRLLAWCAAGSAAGALLGSALLTRMPSAKVKKVIGLVLLAIAVKMAWGLLH